jgi:L-galactose dehydrogenase
MIYRPLGQTGLNVSIIGFGASPLGDVFGTVTPQAANAAVAHAIDNGINLFDVSPYYGLTLAEERLGAALHGRRHEITLATKCGRYATSAPPTPVPSGSLDPPRPSPQRKTARPHSMIMNSRFPNR